MKLSSIAILSLPVRWIETNNGPLRVASLGDMPVVDYDWLLSLEGPTQQIEVDFVQETIKLTRQPVEGQPEPLTLEGLALLVRQRAEVLREQG